MKRYANLVGMIHKKFEEATNRQQPEVKATKDIQKGSNPLKRKIATTILKRSV